ncbi:hypothetical protein MHLP_04385 [Candidatus Mycoplasma haematolamae str. Purdue]|uniref:Uncharacterized protein n=1 Tax=Mycoplasma haematolamae (strain Purdue) TaxID=1212765 RepID=I7C7F0_MYCHA|nr:hypothetical protein [Candidatus Mycoplasma haematolamae]AFO52457.1 hypothetical protein MHLP_04385 [Candidatus Mycoplasma haematolamae str. Purdue]
MIWSIHPGIWGAVATLFTGVTANVVISSAYQANGGIVLDFENLSDDVIHGTFDRNDEVKAEQNRLYRLWKTASPWYMGHCMNKTHPEGDIKKTQCAEHRRNYRNAPEVKGGNFTWKDLSEYLQKLEGRGNVQTN